MKRLFIIMTLIGLLLIGCNKASSKVNYKFLAPTQNKTVAKHKDIVVTQEMMLKGLKSEIYKKEREIYDLKFGKIKTIMIEAIIKKDPKSKGLTNDQYLEKFISSKIVISDKDVEAFIKEKNIPAKHVNPEIKVKIRDHLKAKGAQSAIEAWLAKQTGSSPIEIYLDKPVAPKFKINTEGAASYGPNDAKVTLIEFSDFQCPFCAKGADIVNALKKKYKGKVRFVFKHFPLSFHKQAETAAVASMCVNEQDGEKFWKMHDLMFADQSKLSVADLTATAKSLGVDISKFSECLKTMKHLGKIKADIADGKKVGIDSTPTFYVNGKLVSGAQPIEVFSELIDEEL